MKVEIEKAKNNGHTNDINYVLRIHNENMKMGELEASNHMKKNTRNTS